MMLFWPIRYFDCSDKQFKDRSLYLQTENLEPATRAAVELVAKYSSSEKERGILKFRKLFVEHNSKPPSVDPKEWRSLQTICLDNYHEDETGKEMSLLETVRIRNGDPNAMLIPHGAKQHDIDLMLAEPKPIPVIEVDLGPDEVRLLGYFVRDLLEMQDSAFMKDGPGSLSSFGPSLETAVTDEEIRSFVTIFRRLYMDKEPANFQKAVAVIAKALNNHPYAKWASCSASEFKKHLDSVLKTWPFVNLDTCTFTTKRLIDVFLYTQYAHQPDAKRQSQFAVCLNQVNGKRDLLTWLFLTEIWKCTLEICRVGRFIKGWFDEYCNQHDVSPDVLNSLRDEHSGLGKAEKKRNREARLYQETVKGLATEIWMQNGIPEGGMGQFLAAARDELNKQLNN